MTSVEVTLRLLSPFSLGAAPEGRRSSRRPEVPATTLRGALGWMLAREAREGSEGAEVLLARGFGDWPAIVSWTNAHPPGRLLPASAVSCKRRPGFRDAGGHGVFDTLIDAFCWAAQRPPVVVYSPVCPNERCGEDEVRTYSHYRPVEGGGTVTPPAHHSLTRVALSRSRMSVEPGLLYTPLVMSERLADNSPTEFRCLIRCEDDLAQPLVDALQRVRHLGSGSSRGLGLVAVQAQALEPEPDGFDRLVERLEQFSALLRRCWSDWRQLGGREGGEPDPRACYFSLDLRSPGLFGTPSRPSLDPTAELSLRLAPPVELLRSQADGEAVVGWNERWGLPRPRELGAKAGSTYLLLAGAGLAAAAPALYEIERRGLGRRLDEGCGEVAVCDPVHTIRWENRA